MKLIGIFLGIVVTLPCFSADHIVEEFGQPPAFASIGAAVAAADDGDRILIKNRPGNIPWVEHITVDKSLEFLSYTNDDFFVVQGDYSIDRASDRKVVFIGMRNTSGNIIQGEGPYDNRSVHISILDCWFQNGGVQLSSNTYDAQIIGCKFDMGRIRIGIGNIIGNDVYGEHVGAPLVDVNNSTVAFLGDTLHVIGNKIRYINSESVQAALRVGSRQQIVHIRNNYIRFKMDGLRIHHSTDEPTACLIYNNTIIGEGPETPNQRYGIGITNLQDNSVWEIMNNVVISDGLNGFPLNAIYNGASSATVNAYYNHISPGWSTAISGTFVFNDLNQLEQDIQLNIEDGTFANVNSAIDGGNPAALFYNLDLSPNDAGAYGGSYTLDNFFPQHTGSARIGFATYPFNVRDGITLRVNAVSFDR